MRMHYLGGGGGLQGSPNDHLELPASRGRHFEEKASTTKESPCLSLARSPKKLVPLLKFSSRRAEIEDR